MPLLLLENVIVNTEHIVRVDWYPGEPAKEEWDDDYRRMLQLPPTKAKVVITLTSLEAEEFERDYDSGFHLAAAPKSEVVRLHGEAAEKAWLWFGMRAVKPGEEWTAEVAA